MWSAGIILYALLSGKQQQYMTNETKFKFLFFTSKKGQSPFDDGEVTDDDSEDNNNNNLENNNSNNNNHHHNNNINETRTNEPRQRLTLFDQVNSFKVIFFFTVSKIKTKRN